MVSNNIPQVKLGIIAVSRDCFPIALSTQRPRINSHRAYSSDRSSSNSEGGFRPHEGFVRRL